MRVARVLASLAKQGAYVRVLDGDRLEYVGPAELLTDDVRAVLREWRPEVVAWLRTPATEQPAGDLELFDFSPHAFEDAPHVFD